MDAEMALTEPVAAKGLVVLDVDGVLFPDQFLLALARRRGWPAFVRTLGDCLLFNVGRLTVEALLRGGYGRLAGMPWTELCRAYREMPLAPGAAETVAALRRAGMRVILLTAGAPDELVKDLAARLGADAGAGIAVETRDGLLTGRVHGELITGTGKLDHVTRVIERAGLSWRQVVAVGDDPNNLGLMRRAGRGIGFHATYPVRHEADRLVESDNLAAILPHALPEGEALSAMEAAAARRPWHREVLRKLFHMTAAAVPFLVIRFPVTVSLLIVVAMALYMMSEFWRLNGVYIPVVHRINRMVMRRYESRGLATGPLTLALGVLFALWCLPPPIGLACILIAAVGDSCAAIVGSRWGRSWWPHNPRKSLEGSAAFLLSALICALVYLPFPQAVPLALTAAAIESMPLQDWDNFLTPVGAGMLLAVAL